MQELEETQYWIELLAESNMVKPEKLSSLTKESDELLAILVTSVRTLKSRMKRWCGEL